MSYATIFVLALLGASLVLALWSTIRHRKDAGCTGVCSGCKHASADCPATSIDYDALFAQRLGSAQSVAAQPAAAQQPQASQLQEHEA